MRHRPFHLTCQQASCRLHAAKPVRLFLIRRLEGPDFPGKACVVKKHPPGSQQERGSVLAYCCQPPYSVALHTEVQAMEHMRKPYCFLILDSVVVAFDCSQPNAAAF